MWKRVSRTDTLAPPYKSIVQNGRQFPSIRTTTQLVGGNSQPAYYRPYPDLPQIITPSTTSPGSIMPDLKNKSVGQSAALPFGLHENVAKPQRFDVFPTQNTSNQLMTDNIKWVTEPTISHDGSLTGSAEKFQIRINTDGFQQRDIDVYTKNGKMHVKAFRQEINKDTGAQITNRLERSYDIPYDADANSMTVSFCNDKMMIVEFRVSKPAFCNSNVQRSESESTMMKNKDKQIMSKKPTTHSSMTYYNEQFPTPTSFNPTKAKNNQGYHGQQVDDNNKRTHRTKNTTSDMIDDTSSVIEQFKRLSNNQQLSGSDQNNQIGYHPVNGGVPTSAGISQTHKATLVNVKGRSNNESIVTHGLPNAIEYAQCGNSEFIRPNQPKTSNCSGEGGHTVTLYCTGAQMSNPTTDQRYMRVEDRKPYKGIQSEFTTSTLPKTELYEQTPHYERPPQAVSAGCDQQLTRQSTKYNNLDRKQHSTDNPLPVRNSVLPSYPRIVVDDQTGAKKVAFSIEVRGFDPQDFNVSVNNSRLLIEANHVVDRNSVAGSSGGAVSTNSPSGSQKRYFRKEVTLPAETDINRLRTLLIDGCVLEIEAPVLESQWISVPIERKS